MVPPARAQRATRESEARRRSLRSASRAGLLRLRSARPVSTASGALGRNTPDRDRARRARRSRSRDGRRGPGRRCRRRRRRGSLVSRPFAPLHLEGTDAYGVAFLRAERAQLALDSRADELALKVGGRVGRLPADPRREPPHAIAFDPERFSFALHVPVAPTPGERDAALARRQGARGLTRRAAIEDLA